MKTIAAFAMVLTFGTAALAKPAPIAPAEYMPVGIGASAIFLGPVGAMFESDYFRAPQAQSSAEQIFSCRVRQLVFDKTRIARSRISPSCN